MGKICTFFGHRDIYYELIPFIKEQARRLITEENVDTFWVGGHGKFDSQAISALRNLQHEYPHIKIILVIAYVSQLHRYGTELPFDGFDYPPAAEAAPYRFAISARNRYMAQNTDFVIACVLSKYGGAYEALRIAARCNKTIINLADIVWRQQKN